LGRPAPPIGMQFLLALALLIEVPAMVTDINNGYSILFNMVISFCFFRNRFFMVMSQ